MWTEPQTQGAEGGENMCGREVRRGTCWEYEGWGKEWEGGVGGAYDPDALFTRMKLPTNK